MSVIIRLQNLPLTASSIDIRTFFRGLSIPDGGVHIVGGSEGDTFIAFSTDEDARQAMQLSGQKLKDSTVQLLLSSRNEMFKVIEQARTPSLGHVAPPASLARPGTNSPSSPSLLASTTPSHTNNSNNGGFPTSAVGNLLGGMGMSGVNSNNFTPHHSQGMGLPGMNMGMNGFPSQMTSSTSNTNNNMGAADVNIGNSNPFGMGGMPGAMHGMAYPAMMNSGHGLGMSQPPPMGMNQPPPMMGNMGIPPPMMMNNQNPLSFQATRGAMNNNMNNGSGSTMTLPPNIANMLGNLPRPGGFIPGMNPNFTNSGMGMGNMVRPNGPPAPRFSAPNNSARERTNVGPNSNGPIRHSVVNVGKPELGRDPRDIRSRSGSMERRDGSRRRRSRSHERDRGDRRRRHSRSKSRSRSPKGRLPTRRDSRDRDERRKGETSPDKSRDIRGRRDSDPVPNAYNMTDEEYPGIKLSGIQKDASYREIRDFLRVDIMGGGDGTVRLYDEGIAYVKLEKPSDYSRAYRSNGRKLRNSVVSMEGISIERWVNEYKMNKSRVERDIDRDRERDRVRDRDDRGSERDRPERTSRPSRFNTASQSSFIVIRNLPPTITSRDVSTRLLKDAPVTDMIVAAGPVSNGRHTAMAYVKLESPQATQKTIDLIVRSQEGANLVVETCDQDEFNRAKTRTPGRTDRETNKPTSGLGDGAKSIFDLESGLDEESCSVMLKGAPPHVSERDIFDFFSDIGLVPSNVKIMYDTNGACNGQILCEFLDPHKARRATTKDGMLFGRGHVEVHLITSGRMRGSDLSNLTKGLRPALLGQRPPISAVNPRFGVPPGPNPFIQALQAVNGTPRPTGGPHGARMRGPHPHPSRFNARSDFDSTSGEDKDDRLGSGRARGSGGSHVVEGDVAGMPQFGKSGCVLSLENVPYKASMDDILHHLSSILKLDISRERIIRRFDDLENPTGDARVAFDTPAEAKLAHDRLSGTKMWNRLITYEIV